MTTICSRRYIRTLSDTQTDRKEMKRQPGKIAEGQIKVNHSFLQKTLLPSFVFTRIAGTTRDEDDDV